MSKKNVEEQIISELVVHIKTNFGGGMLQEIPLNTSLMSSGILDSFAIIELAEYIENKWDFHIEDDDFIASNFGSIEKMASFIARSITKAK